MILPFAENDTEEAALAWLTELGYSVKNSQDIAPDSETPERTSYADVTLSRRLQGAIQRLNPELPSEACEDAVRMVKQVQYPDLVEENRRLHSFMVEGVPVEFYGEDGVLKADHVRLIDFNDPENNDWLALNQFTVIENKTKRRPDIVLFLNGLPLVVIELKSASNENATLDAAFNQLQTYKNQISSLFRTNAALVISDGIEARIGSLTASRERFMPWRTDAIGNLTAKGIPELETLLKGAFNKRRFLQLLQDFILFGETSSGLVKILAGYHQFHAVHKAISRTLKATSPEGDRRAGVIWHTQGSGKSLLMAFYAGQIVKHPGMENPTLIILSDRNDLDDQLFNTFSMCKDLLRQTPIQAENRNELRTLLCRPCGGVIFTTIQKFFPENKEITLPPVTDRQNVVVIADEAHRSQYGFKARFDKETGKISYGFAKHMRDALPNASFIGFTGTPIENDDVNTPHVFGNYIDTYDISRAVEDKATVSIYYESRLARIDLPDDLKPAIDAKIAELTDDVSESEGERLNRKFTTVEAVVGTERRLSLIAADLVNHAEARFETLKGKAMVVCMSRRICVALYNEIVKLRPGWHSGDDNRGAIKVVMTGNASDPPSWQPHIGTPQKARCELLAKRIKDPDDPLKLVLVRDMWLTGFDAPSMHTMYVDKPMRGHSLMQAIARVNRVFKDKPAGLIVDYIGIAQNLKSALNQYSKADRDETGIKMEEAVAALMEKYEIVRDMFHPDLSNGFDYRPALSPDATPRLRLSVMAGAIEWVLSMQQVEAEEQQTEEGKKRSHRRYLDAVLALSKAYALAAASDDAHKIRDEVGFFQAIRAALVKSTGSGSGKSAAERELAIQQLVSRAVVSTEIVNIMKAAGIESPDISILSDDFLAEVRQFNKKNLALEALRRLINGEIHAQSRRNVTRAKAFSERLESAIARYHANALTTVQALEELIVLAKEIRMARQRGDETGLSDDEIAFYDALADNESARDLMGEDQLLVIAKKLVKAIQANVTVDWAHRESARANIRRHVKRILRRYGYPPDLQYGAVQKVLLQAETLSASVSGAGTVP
ncbi:MAG: type I restriction endonuclease subunit R [Synechococcus sp. SB0678_bin_12]|nr:type I restriction endonuclease subunit R [Synechococcus sp. SB0678_bin_12]MYI87432.1 type I restriction endonuclease subunit R [Synechococcus sp. SB0672_bin_10]